MKRNGNHEIHMIFIPDYATDEWSRAAVKTISLDEQQVKESKALPQSPSFSRQIFLGKAKTTLLESHDKGMDRMIYITSL